MKRRRTVSERRREREVKTKRERLERLSLERGYLLREPVETDKARETHRKKETNRDRGEKDRE